MGKFAPTPLSPPLIFSSPFFMDLTSVFPSSLSLSQSPSGFLALYHACVRFCVSVCLCAVVVEVQYSSPHSASYPRSPLSVHCGKQRRAMNVRSHSWLTIHTAHTSTHTCPHIYIHMHTALHTTREGERKRVAHVSICGTCVAAG